MEALLSGGVVGLDNIDGPAEKDAKTRTSAPWLPDVLAHATTGGVIRRRRLYSDGSETCRPISAALILTTRNPTFVRTDVSERVLPILTAEIPDDRRIADSDLMDAVIAQRDGLLSWAALQGSAMLERRADAPAGLPLRFVDFARCVWTIAGDDAPAICQALRAAQALAVQESDPLLNALIAHVDALMGWYTPTDLIVALTTAGADLPFLHGGKAISRRLRELHHTAALAGLTITENRSGNNTLWQIIRTP